MLNLASYVKTVKPFLKNQKTSNENLLNDVLSPFIYAGEITNKDNDDYILDKTRSSRILKQKEEVPKVLRKALERIDIREKTVEEFGIYIEDKLVVGCDSDLISELQKLVRNSPNISKERKDVILCEKNSLPALMTDVLMAALVEKNLLDDEKQVILRFGTSSVSVKYADLFKYGFENRSKKKNIVVIPVNTSFETQVTKNQENDYLPLVSENTLHGQWLIRWIQSGNTVEKLDERIAKSLEMQGYKSERKSSSEIGKRDCYPIGAVAIIESENAVYYLLAIAEFDKKNVARSSREDIQTSLLELLHVYDERGQGYELYLPLIGSGRSRTGLDLQDSYELLKNILLKNKTMISGNIHLIINPIFSDQISIKEA